MKVLLDTNVYVGACASPGAQARFRTSFFPLVPLTVLSAVVAYELRVNAFDERTRQLVDEWVRPMEQFTQAWEMELLTASARSSSVTGCARGGTSARSSWASMPETALQAGDPQLLLHPRAQAGDGIAAQEGEKRTASSAAESSRTVVDPDESSAAKRGGR